MKKTKLFSLLAGSILGLSSGTVSASTYVEINGTVPDLLNQTGTTEARPDPIPDALLLPSVGATPPEDEIAVKFTGDSIVEIDHMQTDGFFGTAFLGGIDVNGTNSTINADFHFDDILVMGGVKDSVGNGKLTVNITNDNSFHALLLNPLKTEVNFAGFDIIPFDSVFGIKGVHFNNVDFNFNNHPIRTYVGDAAFLNMAHLASFNGKFLNESNSTLQIQGIMVYRGENQEFNFSSITSGQEVKFADDLDESKGWLWIDKEDGTNLSINTDFNYQNNDLVFGQNFGPIDHLIASTPVTIKDKSISGALENGMGVTIASFDFENQQPSELTFMPNGNINLRNLGAEHKDSTYTLNSSNHDQDVAFGLNQNLGAYNGDISTNIRLVANQNPLSLYDADVNHSIGNNVNSRAKSVSFEGDSDININVPIYAQKLIFNQDASTILQQSALLWDNGIIELQNDAEIFTEALIAANHPTINLNDNRLLFEKGEMTFSGNAVINSKFTPEKGEGTIYVGDGDFNALLDMSFLTSMKINFDADLSGMNMVAIVNEFGEAELPLFEELDNGTIKHIGDTNKISFAATDNNLFVNWEYDKEEHVIRSITDLDGLQGIVKQSASSVATAITNAIVESAKAVDNEEKKKIILEAANANEIILTSQKATQLIQKLGTLPPEEIVEALENINPQNTLENNREANDDSMEKVSERIFSAVLDSVTDNSFAPSIDSNNISPITIQDNQGADIIQFDNKNVEVDIKASELGAGVAAGDDIAKKYGIWASPFIHKARQKKMGTQSGYNVTNFGAAIGADTKIDDSKTIGFAWSHIKSTIKHKDIMLGSKGVTNTNIFSLYGTKEFNNNYFLSAIGSYGISKINNNEKRVLSSSVSAFAKSKYKTKIYSAQIIGGKTIPFGSKYFLTPLLGLKYSEFHDDAYEESGTLVQNNKVSKKKTTQLDGILGMKLAYPTNWNEHRIKPYLSAMANIHLKENPPTSYVTSDTFINTIKLKGDKSSSKAWYALGGGVDLYKGDIDYSFDYEAQFDKKYVGHQAKLKVRVNF